jgi:hypothetical protein
MSLSQRLGLVGMPRDDPGEFSFLFSRRLFRRQTLTFLGCHDVNATWYLGHPFAVTFRTPYLRGVVLADGFNALERFAAFFATILITRHVSPPSLGQPVLNCTDEIALTRLSHRMEDLPCPPLSMT